MRKTITSISALTCLTLNNIHANISEMNSQIEASEILSIPQNRQASSSPAMLHLRQPWNSETDDNFRPGHIQLSWSPSALHIHAVLIDDSIFTQATADTQKMWELGDVFEIFLQVEGREDYAELHITPNNKRLQIHKPNAEGKPSPEADPLPIEKMFVSSIGFTSKVERISNGWKVIATVPHSVLGVDSFTSGTKLLVSFCRYDAAIDSEPTLSTTASHTFIDFHQPDDWTQITLSK